MASRPRRSRVPPGASFLQKASLTHPPRAVGLTAGRTASKFGTAVDIDLLRVGRATISGTVAIIITDLQVAVGVAPLAPPIVAGMRAARFKAAVIGIDFVAAVLAIQAVAADASTDHAAEDCTHRRPSTALR